MRLLVQISMNSYTVTKYKTFLSIRAGATAPLTCPRSTELDPIHQLTEAHEQSFLDASVIGIRDTKSQIKREKSQQSQKEMVQLLKLSDV